jgi:hypothetical protein
MNCPRCGEPVRVPGAEGRPDGAPAGAPSADPPAPLPARLGVASLALGLLAVLVLCLPVVGYASFALSGLGLLLGLGGLVGQQWGGVRGAGRPEAGGARVAFGLGVRPLNYPLAGVAACLAALALALAPLLFR